MAETTSTIKPKQDLEKLFEESQLQQSLDNTPEPIKIWLGSERVVYFIMDINHKLRITGERMSIIPRLILRLEVRDLPPQEFADALAKELEIPASEAQKVNNEIKARILKPIKKELFDWGVDIELMEPLPGIEIIEKEEEKVVIPAPAEEKKEEIKPAEPKKITIKVEEEKPAEIKPKEGPPQGTPFMLFQKEEQARVQPQISEAIKSKITETIGPERKPSAPKATARLEIEGVEQPRTVHYSENSTPSTSSGQVKSENKPIKKQNGPKLNGNIIDLR